MANANDGRAPQESRALPAGCLRVLVVEDEPDGGESLRQLLLLYGHQAEVARDGPAALALAERFLPDVVLLDIGLPGTNGLEVARRMRQNLGLTDALLVALTGYGQDEDRRRSHEAGFNAHLVKPVDLDSLEKLLARPQAATPGQPGAAEG
jgi:CheY-like chemotaxis protein